MGLFYQPVCICGKHAICLGYVTYSRSKPVVYIDHDTVCQWQTYVLRTFFCREIQKRNLDKIVVVGENLSYANERITIGKAKEILSVDKFDMNVVVILDEK